MSWKCKCGQINENNFCIACGSPKPQDTINEAVTPIKTTGLICKNCKSTLRLDTETGLLKCDNCGSTFTYAEYGMGHEEIDGIAFDPNSDEWKERYKIQPDNEYDTYTCPQCKATIEVAKSDTWMKCPYCDTNLSTAEKIDGRVLPDYVIPYAISQSKVIEMVKEKLKKYFFLNKLFYNNIENGELRPLFIPIWTYSGDIKSKIDYIEAYEEGSDKNKIKREYRYNGEIEAEMLHASIDADKDFDNSISVSMADYDMSTAVKYNSKAVMGIKSELFNDLPTTCWNYINNQMKDVVSRAAIEVCNHGRDDLGKKINHRFGLTDHATIRELEINNIKLKYGLVPIYHAHYAKQEIYINGQTGTIAHTALPLNKLKVAISSMLILLINIIVFMIVIIKGFDLKIALVTLVLWLILIVLISQCRKSSLGATTGMQRWFGLIKAKNFNNGYGDVSINLQKIEISDDDAMGNKFLKMGEKISSNKAVKVLGNFFG